MKNAKLGSIASLVILAMFLAGIALIAVGVWMWSPALALVYIGCALIYISYCVYVSSKSVREDEAK